MARQVMAGTVIPRDEFADCVPTVFHQVGSERRDMVAEYLEHPDSFLAKHPTTGAFVGLRDWSGVLIDILWSEAALIERPDGDFEVAPAWMPDGNGGWTPTCSDDLIGSLDNYPPDQPAMTHEGVTTHPSYGTIQISRCHGSTNLFGSNLPRHEARVDITVNAAEMSTTNRTLSERVHPHESLIRISLSPTQYTQMISTMNIGDGIPCTIIQWGPHPVPPHPSPPTRIDRVEDQANSSEQALQIRAECVRDHDARFTQKTLDLIWSEALERAGDARLMGDDSVGDSYGGYWQMYADFAGAILDSVE